jgi:hypothetical protein
MAGGRRTPFQVDLTPTRARAYCLSYASREERTRTRTVSVAPLDTRLDRSGIFELRASSCARGDNGIGSTSSA